MYEPKVNEIVIEKSKFDNDDELAAYLGKLTMSLTKLDYEVSITDEDEFVFIVSYVYNARTAQEYGAPQFMVLDQDEVDTVLFARSHRNEDGEPNENDD